MSHELQKKRPTQQKVRCSLRTSLSTFLAVVILATSGCRKAEVEQHTQRIVPTLSVGDPAYIVRTKVTPTEPWYRDYQAVLDSKPTSEKELDLLVAEKKPAVSDALMTLLEDIRKTIESKHQNNDKWSLYSLNGGRPRRGADIQFTGDICLTKLFSPRPVIAFNNIPLDIGIAKLSRETGIQDSIPRNYNPRVYWSKTNVSVYEAIHEILKQHGYVHRFTDTSYRVTLRFQDFKTKEAFMDAAVKGLLEKANALNIARPALVVTPLEKNEKIVTPENSDDTSPLDKDTNPPTSVPKNAAPNKETPPN